MKLHIKYIALSLLAAGAAACSEEVYTGTDRYPAAEQEYLSVEGLRNFSADGDIQSLYVRTSNGWKLDGLPDWLTSSNKQFGSVELTAQPNPTLERRTALLTVNSIGTAHERSVPLEANQLAREGYLVVPDITVPPHGIDTVINIDTNLDVSTLTRYISTEDKSWMQASLNGSKLRLQVAGNPGKFRKGQIYVYGKMPDGSTLYDAMNVYQDRATVGDTYTWNVNGAGGSATWKIDTKLDWSISTDADWLSVSPSSGKAADATQIKVTAAPSYQADTRQGQVVLHYLNSTEDNGHVTVTQAGRYLRVSPTSITMEADNAAGNVYTADVESDVEWKIQSAPDWLDVTVSGSQLQMKPKTNTSLVGRSGRVDVIEKTVGLLRASVSVSQKAYTFSTSQTMEFNFRGETQQLTLPFSNPWTASVSSGWITLSKYYGETGCELGISVSRNDSDYSRTGTVTIKSEGKTYDISVYQRGQYITVNNTNSNFTATGGTLSLTVGTSMELEQTFDWLGGSKDWITAEPTSDGKGYKLTVSFNPSTKQRTADFVLTPTDTDVSEKWQQGVKVHITQAGRTLSASVAKLMIKNAGGTTPNFKIVADGKYELVKKNEADSWFTIVKDPAPDTYYVVINENQSGNRKGALIARLLELPDGEDSQLEIPVMQGDQISDINVQPYPDDENKDL